MPGDITAEIQIKIPLSHAELNAIRKASRKLGDWRLEGCTLYVTLEPCQMCAGAIIQARMDRVVIGQHESQGGLRRFCAEPAGDEKNSTTRRKWRGGVLEEECGSLLSSFFRRLRERKKQQTKEEC